ncbi:MAG: hypothetical protein KC550_02255 [Nanoarchaeota archaeon]|nr:hypothetical protein [Nanoarchaeota archaeon]
MTEKDKLLDNLLEKSGKSKEEIGKLVAEKIEELSGLVSEEGAIYIIANELGVRLEGDKPKKDADLTKIKEITESRVPVSLMCKVIRKYDRINFSSNAGNEGSVQSCLAGDETGITRLTFWNDKTELLDNIHDGDILKITNAYTRENNNNPDRIDVHYGQYSDLEVNPDGVEIVLPEFKGGGNIDFTQKKISELEEGERNVKLIGIITDFDIPRFYLASPKTFKKVLQDDGKYLDKDTNEEVEPIKVPIVNVILDDSSGTIAVVGFRDRAEELTKISGEEIIALTENIDKYRDFSKKIIGAKVEIGGNVSINNMTGEKQLLANQIMGVDLKDVDELANELIDEVVSENSREKSKKKDEKSKASVESKKKLNDDDIDDIEIEEIEIDDDLL